MVQPVNRFGIDEVNTQLTAPTSNIQVQGVMDTSLTTRTRSEGINSLANSLENLAKKKLANKIHNDTIDAQLASAYDREQPEGLEPEAIFAFNKSEDLKLSAQIQQNLQNYAIVEGAEILNDQRLSRKQKLSQFQLGMQAIINIGKQGITPVNGNEIFPILESEYNKFDNLAATELAKQKIEEESSINGAAIDTMWGNIINDIADPLLRAASGQNTIVEDDDLSPEDFAQLSIAVTNKLAVSGASVKNFNGIVNHISKTKRGAGNKEIKAATLTSLVGRILKAVEEGNVNIDPKLVTNLIDNIKGHPQVKGSTLRSEINSGSEYGKIFKTIEDGFTSKLKTLQTDKRTARNNAVTDRDNYIGNTLFDAPDGTYTQQQGQDMLRGMTNFKTQNAARKRWDAQFKAGGQNGSTSSAYLEALSEWKSVLSDDGKSIDEPSFTQLMIDKNLKPEAATKYRDFVDPQKKAAKHRTAVLENKQIVLLQSQFRGTIKATLLNNGFSDIVNEYFNTERKEGDPEISLLTLAAIKQQVGSSSVIYNQAEKILQAEIKFAGILEQLIIDYPDKTPIEIAAEAKTKFDSLFSDIAIGENLGYTEEELKKLDDQGKLSKLESRLLGLGKTIRGEASSSKETTTEQELEDVQKSKQETLTTALQDFNSDPEVVKKYLALAAKEVDLAQKAATAAAEYKTATRGEQIRTVLEKGGIPSVTEDAMRTIAAFGTNKEAYLILRAKRIQQMNEKEKNELSKNVFLFRTEEEMRKNAGWLEQKIVVGTGGSGGGEGTNILRIGSFQFTTDDLKHLTWDSAKNFPGNIGFYLAELYDSIRAFPKRASNRPNRPIKDEVVPKIPVEDQEPIRKEKVKSIVKEPLSNLNKLVDTTTSNAGAEDTTLTGKGNWQPLPKDQHSRFIRPTQLKKAGISEDSLVGYLKRAEADNKVIGKHPDPSKKVTQTNYGFGVKVTPEVQTIIDTMRAKGKSESEIADATLLYAISQKSALARKRFNGPDIGKGFSEGDISYEDQPERVQELLTEIEYSTGGGLLGYEKLVEAARKGDYEKVKEEMLLDPSKQGAPRRNDLRKAYFSDLAPKKEKSIFSDIGDFLGPSSAEAATEQQKPSQYVIKSGDTLSGIARDTKIPMEQLMQLNQISNPNKIRAGQTLNLEAISQEAPSPVAPSKAIIKKEINVGAKSLPKVQGEVIEEVAEKSIANPNDGMWDFNKNIIRPIKDVARASLNTIPMHLRFVVDYVTDNKLLGGGEQTVVSERHMTPEVVNVLKTAIKNAKKRGATRVDYVDFPMPKSGIPVHALFEAAGKVTKGQVKAGKDRWSSTFMGVMRMMGDSFDPIIAASGTFGAFGFKEVDGEYIIEDVYDFSKFQGEATTAYSTIRKWISTEQGDKTYKTVANLGKIG